MDQQKAYLRVVMSELYNTEILRLTTQIPHLARLSDADVSAVKTSRICGSRITAEARVQDGVITEFGQEVKACALGQASAAIVGEQVIGLSEAELSDIAARFRHMVKTGEVDFPQNGKSWAYCRLSLIIRGVMAVWFYPLKCWSRCLLTSMQVVLRPDARNRRRRPLRQIYGTISLGNGLIRPEPCWIRRCGTVSICGSVASKPDFNCLKGKNKPQRKP